MNKKSIFLSAGDPSGDNASSKLVEALGALHPDIEYFGLGGERLKKLGQEQFASGAKLAVLGFWEVVKHYSFFKNLMNRCIKEIEKRKPSVVLLVDYPGFNLRLAKKIKHLQIPIIYYISPQVWAWGKRRIKEIRKNIDLMLPILPFEEIFYEHSGVNSKFVGHYLLEDISENYLSSKTPAVENEKNTIALLPGSRPQEIERMLIPSLEAAKMFNAKYGTRAVVAGIKGVYDYENILRQYDGSDISIVYNKTREIIFKSSLVISASGTATLEVGIIGRPMVVIYKTGFITYNIARHLVKLDKIALANLVMDEIVVPELIQNDATPEKIFTELEKYWQDNSYYDSVQNRLFSIPSLLGGKGASDRTAKLISEYL